MQCNDQALASLRIETQKNPGPVYGLGDQALASLRIETIFARNQKRVSMIRLSRACGLKQFIDYNIPEGKPDQALASLRIETR